MILTAYRNNKYRPVFVCDVCQQRITDAMFGAAVSTMHHDPDVDLLPVLHVHKGECLDKAEKDLMQKTGGEVGWDELSVHLIRLVANSSLTLEDLERIARMQHPLS